MALSRWPFPRFFDQTVSAFGLFLFALLELISLHNSWAIPFQELLDYWGRYLVKISGHGCHKVAQIMGIRFDGIGRDMTSTQARYVEIDGFTNGAHSFSSRVRYKY
jgi:ABC-type antimicrobial peptide transport system permease subunit